MENHNTESEDWLKDLFDHAHDLIQIVALDGTLKHVNKSWTQLLQYNTEEIIGKSIYDYLLAEDRNMYLSHREKIMSGEIQGKPIIVNLVAKNGTIIPVEGVVSVKLNNEQQPMYTRGIFRDISDRLQTEKRLKQLNDRLQEREYNLQQLLIYAPDAIVVIDENSTILYWNPKAEEIFGWNADEVVNTCLSNTIIPTQFREAHESGMRRYLQTGEKHVLNRTVEITALKKSGEEFHISLTISRTTQHGKTAFVAFIRDITEQKEAVSNLEEKSRQLELSNRSLEAFAYAASHDLKQPVRKVQIFTEQLAIAADARLTKTEKGYLQKTQKAAERMRDLIEDLLTYSSLTGTINFAERVDLNGVLHDVTEDLEIEINEKNAKINIGRLPTVLGNKRQLQQLFHNLVGNAVKYSKAGEPAVVDVVSVEIKGSDSLFLVSQIEANRIFHLVQVTDKGIGFDQEHASRIFDIFTRLHNQDRFQGSGVGLAIARKVVDNHNGYIMAEGKEGEGAVFTVLLPAISNERD